MTDLTPDHPAVEAALLVVYGHRDETCAPEMADAITAALPHLTADDLRDTPAGKQLMAEAWVECADEAHDLGWLHGPARDDMDCRNPHREPTS